MPTLRQKKTDNVLRMLREKKGQAKFGELFMVMFDKYGLTKNAFRDDLNRLRTSGQIEYPENFPAGFEHEVLIKLSKDVAADVTPVKLKNEKKRKAKRKMKMTAEIPDEISKDFEEIGKTTRFRNIKMAVNYLNSQLQSMFVHRSQKTRDGKEAKVRKYWLQLVFAVNEQSVTKREPLPLVFQVEMVNAVCSKCGFEWRTSFGAWLTFSCPKCGSFEIGIEDEKKS